MMPLDECLAAGATKDETYKSLELTTRWAKRSKEYLDNNAGRHSQNSLWYNTRRNVP